MILHVSGEHSENIVTEEKLIDGTLLISTGFSPFFVLENDKLAAHKLIAIHMDISVPENFSVAIKSNLASVFVSGDYKNLLIALENGGCFLNDFSGNAHLRSTQGDIMVIAQEQVSGRATSKDGIVDVKLPKYGKYTILAESVTGNISMEQTK